jgi:hypothetical protein
MRTRNIGDLRANIEQALKSLQGSHNLPSELQALQYLVPEGAVPEVSLRYRDDNRKIRRNASADYWKPDSCQAVITYETEGERTPEAQRLKPPAVLTEGNQKKVRQDNGQPENRITELVTALEQAESDPRRQFVALKWFRDQFLPRQGLSWASDPREAGRVLREATNQGLVLTAKVPNPRAPAYPTSTIRLNRTHPEVRSQLSAKPTAELFRPVRIKGERLSQTVLDQRR